MVNQITYPPVQVDVRVPLNTDKSPTFVFNGNPDISLDSICGEHRDLFTFGVGEVRIDDPRYERHPLVYTRSGPVIIESKAGEGTERVMVYILKAKEKSS